MDSAQHNLAVALLLLADTTASLERSRGLMKRPAVRERLPPHATNSRAIRSDSEDPFNFGAQRHGTEVALDELSAALIEVAIERMAEVDAGAEIELALTCPACAAEWRAGFDIAGFLWSEVDAWARRRLREVHVLARAYGWRETEILALSPRRRAAYLGMVEG